MTTNTVVVTKREPVLIEEEENNSFSVKENSTILEEHTVDNVYNIKYDRNFEPDYHSNVGRKYEFPDITFETTEGTLTIENANIENRSELESTCEVTLLGKKTNSDEGQEVKNCSAIGIYETTYMNSFDNECSYITIILSDGEKFTHVNPIYRGAMAQFLEKTCEPRFYGKFERHSGTYKNRSNPCIDYIPPVSSDTNTFTVKTDKGVFDSVVNVRRSSNPQVFALQLEDNTDIYTSNIYDAEGSFYTVCIKSIDRGFKQEGPERTEIKSFKRAIGVYKANNKLYIISHPHTASIYQTPIANTISLDKIDKFHIKQPDGTIVKEIPDYCKNGQYDIPEQIHTESRDTEVDITKEQMKQLLLLRLEGSLQISDEPESDFQNILSGYPEMEDHLRRISDVESLFRYEKILPHKLAREELYNLIEVAEQTQ